MKGRDREISCHEHKAKDQFYKVTAIENGTLEEKEVPLRNAINEVLRDSYIEDCQRGCDRWNKVIEKADVTFRLKIPSRRFHRQVGIYAGHHFAPDGSLISAEEWKRRHDEWLPNESDRAYVRSLMHPVCQPGKIAGWINAPERGISGKPFDFEYVRFE